MSITYVGIDASSSNTAIVLLENNLIIDFKLISPNKAFHIEERIVIIFEELIKYLSLLDPLNTKICLEANSFASKGRVVDLAMLNGVIYYYLKSKHYDIIKVPPSKWKKTMLGKGNLNKKQIEENTEKEIVELFASNHKVINDLIDAYHLAKYRIQ